MFKRSRTRGPKKAVGWTAKPEQVPAPVAGLNTETSIFAMQPLDALMLRNLIPRPYGVALRPGRKLQSHTSGGAVTTLVGHPTSGNLYAFIGTEMYEVSAGGDISGMTPDITGLSSDVWHFVQAGDSANQYLIGVSESPLDSPMIIAADSAIRRMTRDDGAPTTIGNIGGVDPENFTHVSIHQRRVWFVDAVAGTGWYLGTDAVSGNATEFDFNPVFTGQGGVAYASGTWSADLGNGPDDFFVMFSTRGDVVVYAGTDPASASTWAIVGTFYSGRLANRRSLVKFGGDLLFLSEEGLIPMSRLLTQGGSSPDEPSPRYRGLARVQSAVSSHVRNSVNNSRWALVYSPADNLLLINVPPSSDITNSALPIVDVTLVGSYEKTFQLAMDTILGAWGEFDDLDAECWALFDESLYLGNASAIHSFGGVDHDESDTDGDPVSEIAGSAIQAFTDLRAPGVDKYPNLVRASVVGFGPLAITASVNLDYDVSPGETPNFTLSGAQNAVWDTDVWDAGTWGGERVTYRDWSTVGGVGKVVAPVVRITGQARCFWASTEMVYTTGGLL